MKESAPLSIRPRLFEGALEQLGQRIVTFGGVGRWVFRGIYGLALVLLSTNNQNETWFAWRQAQTAMSTQFFMDHGISFVAPRLPVYGPKSLLPFEFPLTQALSAIAASVFGIGSFRATRFVSIVCFVLISIPLRSIVVRYRPKALLPVLAFYFLTPFGIYWASAPMIETTATLFGLSGVALAVSRQTPSKRMLVAASASFILCGLVKMTTLPSYLLLYAALTIGPTWRSKKKLNGTVWMALVTTPSVIATAAWSVYTDRLRSRLPIAIDLTSSSKHLRGWTFGFPGQRTTGMTWLIMLKRLTDFYTPLSAFGTTAQSRQGLLVLGLIATGLITLATKRDGFLLAVIASSATGFLVFVNLYFQHDYYMYAVHPLLAIVAGSTVTSLGATLFQNRGRPKTVAFRLLLTAAVLIPIWTTGWFYVDELFHSTRATAYYSVRVRAEQIRNQVPPTKPVILFTETMGWNPELLYWMGHEGWMLNHVSQFWPKTSEITDVGAIIVDPDSDSPAVTNYRRSLGFTLERSPGTWVKPTG
jgi:hypothetical protein